MRTPLLAGNWKMYRTHVEGARLAEAIVQGQRPRGREVALLPPFTALESVGRALFGTDIALGAQDLCWEKEGAYTGAVSGPMLKALGCRYVVVGHSERRALFGDTAEQVAKKLAAAVSHGLIPILCIGEPLLERDRGRAEVFTLAQLSAALQGLRFSSLVIAYEPIWAIGTGRTALASDAQAMCAQIRRRLGELTSRQVADQVRILYGGSVKPTHIDELMAQPDIDGALVGGASLSAGDFLRIINYQ